MKRSASCIEFRGVARSFPSAGLVLCGGVVFALLARNIAWGLEFERDVGPILADHCLECHSGEDPENGLDLSRHRSALKGGKGGPAIVGGDLGSSLLWQRVHTDEMPPDHPLSESEKTVLREWILAGATWGTEALARFGQTSEKRGGTDWWSLQPVVRPALPAITGAALDLNPIDWFVSEKLQAAGLSSSPPASRRILLRRLSYDLLGLFPEPEDLDSFEKNLSPAAYHSEVDRLLASPAFGERWARHWLDVARFGESHGFERDHIRLHAWRYRDWVVDAFNRNLPYDQFARMQLAGDVMPSNGDEGMIATGFLVAGAYDAVGQSQQSAAMRAVVRQDEIEDYVSTVGQAFLGLTVHCARCHDHKFDPILQREYYQLSATLDGVRPGERGISSSVNLDALDRRIRSLESRLSGEATRVTGSILKARSLPLEAIGVGSPVIEVNAARRPAAGGDLGLESNEWIGLDQWEASPGSTAAVRLTEKTVALEFRITGAFGSRRPILSFWGKDGVAEETIWLDERGEVFLSFRSDNPKSLGRIQMGDGVAQTLALVFAARDRVWLFSGGQPVGSPQRWRALIDYSPNQFKVRLGGPVNEAEGKGRIAVRNLQVFDRALNHREVAARAGVISDHVSESEILDALDPRGREMREAAQFEWEQLRLQRTRWQTSRTYAVRPRKPESVYLLKRGSPNSPGAEVVPAGIGSLKGIASRFGLDGNASDAERRTRLAGWVTDRANPLFARVMVNRLWYYHFGSGLVSTPSDFGFNGGKPSHPELLDWLAAELVDRDWDLKAIHRLIVTSETYRQASIFRPDAAGVDANNRLYWRMTPRRLEAEGLRDATLQVVGRLNRDMGGPGYQDFTTYVHNSQFYEMRDPVGETFDRRSLYRMWIRSGRSPFLDVFDCPDPSATAPKRAVTITPLQSLTLMNNSFVLRMSEALAGRMRQTGVPDLAGEVQNAFQWCYGRNPSELELAESVEMIRRHGRVAFARALLNSNEFLYVD